MTYERPLAVILGAGRPARGQVPAALLSMAGHCRVLDWQALALRTHCAEPVFVGGYRLAEIAALYPALAIAINPSWEQTGAVGSLLRAALEPTRPWVVSYADVLYREDLVRRLCDHRADNVIVIDSNWRQRYDGRSAADIAEAEVLLFAADGHLTAAFGRLAAHRPSAPAAEFIGLARLGCQAIALLQSWAARPEVARWDMPQLLNALLAHGLTIATLDCLGDWAELNAPQDLAHFMLGTKAETLARLRPMVQQCTIGEQVAFTVAQWHRARAECLGRVRSVFGDSALVVRSSATTEDGFHASAAGRYHSVLDVDGTRQSCVGEAVDRVIASYGDDASPDHQVLVQCMVGNIRLSGVVMTRSLSLGAPYRVINYDDCSRSADSVTSGQGQALRTLYVHRDQAVLPLGADEGLQALLMAVCEIEALVGHDSLDIEFIVSGQRTVHVLQIRPIAVDHAHWRGSDDMVRDALKSARNAFVRQQAPAAFVLGRRAPFSVMSDWNPAEMIGTRPRRLAWSIYEALITRDTWAVQRAQYGYRNVAPQPLMRSFAGHAYIDVRASFNSFVPADLDDSLAERLVNDGLDRLADRPELHDKVEFELVFSCLGLDFDQRAQRLVARGFTKDDVQRLKASLRELTVRGVARLSADLAALDRLDARQHCIAAAGLTPLREALHLLDDCRSHGALPFAHLARAGFVAMNLLNSAVDACVISTAERAGYLRSVHTVATDYRHDVERLQSGALAVAPFLANYGHLRPGTYDITVPSYRAAPQRYLELPTVPADAPQPLARSEVAPWPLATCQRFASALSSVGLPLDFAAADQFMRQAIAGRELAKFMFTRSVSRALDQLAAFGEEIGLSRDELSHLSIDDLRAAEVGSLGHDLAGMLRLRADEARLMHELALGVELPPLLLDAHDFNGFHTTDTQANFIGLAVVTAPLLSAEEALTAPEHLAGKIVLARQADPGYDWLFARGIVGLITAYGGANSHMAVRAAEFGLPAAIGVGEQCHGRLASARRLQLDCLQRSITVLQ